jgi:hypothetical protein
MGVSVSPLSATGTQHPLLRVPIHQKTLKLQPPRLVSHLHAHSNLFKPIHPKGTLQRNLDPEDLIGRVDPTTLPEVRRTFV